ncbi:MAG: hypothetical protein KDD33_08155 [Bdellovibrionales bacterium]|nr:hypothetical protein [Bdellovibrionales bacterium]
MKITPRLFFILLFFTVGCQSQPTKLFETDKDFEKRAFEKIRFGEKFDLKRSVIVDTRSRFDHEMSRPPRSFHAYWKDWQLSGLSGENLKKQKQILQRQLALNGVDPLTQVVILGKALQGEGDEFAVAATLVSLGIKKITFVDEYSMQKSLVSLDIPPLANLPYWESDVTYQFDCQGSEPADLVVGNDSWGVKDLFNPDMSIKRKSFPKGIKVRIGDKTGRWAYGLALYLKEQGRQPCVL